jgi:hypothetical protein
MADQILNDETTRQLGGPMRFRTRHVFYLLTVACLLLGVPGWMYVAGVVVGPWIFFILTVGPLMLMQFVFILLIPPLRRRLFRRETPVVESPLAESTALRARLPHD